MIPQKKQTNEEKLSYLKLILEASRQIEKKLFAMCYTIYLVRFGNKVPIVVREPASTDIGQQILKYSNGSFKPDFIVVDLYKGRSHNVKEPFATFKFDYRRRG